MQTHRLAALTIIMLAMLVSACAAAPALERIYDKSLDGITTLSTSSDGTYTLAGTKDTLYCLDAQGETLWRYNTGVLYNTAISADGETIAVSGEKVRIFEINGTLRQARPGDYFASSVAISSDGRIIAVSYENDSVVLMDEMGRGAKSFETPEKLASLAISGDGKFIIGGSDTGSLYLFTPDGRELWKYRLSGQRIMSLTISADGGTIAATSEDMIYLLTRNGRLLWKAATGSTGDASLTADGRLVAAGGDATCLYNRDGDLLLEERGAQKAVAISGDGSHLVAAGNKGVYGYILREETLTAETTELATLATPLSTETETTAMPTEPAQSGMPGVLLCLTALACIIRLRA